MSNDDFANTALALLEEQSRAAVARVDAAQNELDAARSELPDVLRAYYAAAIDTVSVAEQARRIGIGESTLRGHIATLARERRAARRTNI